MGWCCSYRRQSVDSVTRQRCPETSGTYSTASRLTLSVALWRFGARPCMSKSCQSHSITRLFSAQGWRGQRECRPESQLEQSELPQRSAAVTSNRMHPIARYHSGRRCWRSHSALIPPQCRLEERGVCHQHDSVSTQSAYSQSRPEALSSAWGILSHRNRIASRGRCACWKSSSVTKGWHISVPRTLPALLLTGSPYHLPYCGMPLAAALTMTSHLW
jgi:hypothetical protein